MSRCPFSSRRGFLAAAGSVVAAAPWATAQGATASAPGPTPSTPDSASLAGSQPEAFFGPHQGGIVTPQQRHIFVAAFDLLTPKRDEVITLLKAWTAAAARMSQGDTALPLDAHGADDDKPAGDSGEALGLAASRLTLTFGFGPGLFVSQGTDRYGLARHRPAAFVDLPGFNGDQLVAEKSGGELMVQACADDPQVVFHAVRQLARLAYGAAQLRWTQTGFMPNGPVRETPRNLMGFKDGTRNPGPVDARDNKPLSAAELGDVVWVGQDGPDWLRNGSYVVVRRIRIALEHWDCSELSFQEEVVGRHKLSGAPLGQKNEFDPLGLDRTDGDGNPVIPETAHVRLAAPESNGGARILRRSYGYNDGSSFTAERWPPWRQGVEFDAGLLFICYQRDPRSGFIRIFDQMAKLDAMNQFTTHVGSAMFVCPPGVMPGQYIGQSLFEAATT